MPRCYGDGPRHALPHRVRGNDRGGRNSVAAPQEFLVFYTRYFVVKVTNGGGGPLEEFYRKLRPVPVAEYR